MINFEKPWILLLASVPIGAISSLIAWYLLNKVLRPCITFDECISRSNVGNEVLYRFGFENSGIRKIVDVELYAKLSIKGLRAPNIWEVIFLPLDNERIPVIKPFKRNEKKRTMYPRIELRLIDPKYFRFLGVDIINKIRENTITLEELMGLGDNSELTLYVKGYDAISGAKRFFESEPYKLININLTNNLRQSDY